MKVIILGTGTCIPSLRRGASSYLVETEEHKILVDIGPSVVRRLLEKSYTVNDVDIIALTHFHIDHTADLSTFLFASNYGNVISTGRRGETSTENPAVPVIEPRSKPLMLLGGPGIHRFYRQLLSIYPWVLPKTYNLTVRNALKNRLQIGGIIIRSARMVHNRESIAISIEMGRKVVFSGDTDYSRRLSVLAHGANLLVAECSFPDKKERGHMNLSVLEQVVKAAQPERVVISHLYPEWDNFTGILHSPFLLGEDGMEIPL